MSNYRYDAHCHIFTLEYAFKELKGICFDKEYKFKWPAGGLFPDDDEATADGRKTPSWRDFFHILKKFHELIHAAFTSEKENFNFLKTSMDKLYPDYEARIIPLMMDIYYILYRPLDAGQDIGADKLTAAPAAENADMSEEWGKALDAFEEYLQQRNVDKSATSATNAEVIGSAGTPDLADAFALELIKRERLLAKSKPDEKSGADLTARKKAPTGYSGKIQGFARTDGYCFHMDNLMELVANNTGEIYPFVAIDARREGIIDTLLSGAFTTGTPRFYGIKLYPRLGCHPLSAPMEDVYTYCEDHNLPITFHCGMGGFPPSEKWAYSDYGNPKHFESILKKHAKLRIDFAHMGSSDSSVAWKDAVMNLINSYDNVYTDLSCYTDPKELRTMKETYWDKNPKLKDRLMFGTDFDVMYFSGKEALKDYHKSFTRLFSAAEINQMMYVNPSRFMDLP